MVFGTGELYLDCIMHDLRKMYSEIGGLCVDVKRGERGDFPIIHVMCCSHYGNKATPIDVCIPVY